MSWNLTKKYRSTDIWKIIFLPYWNEKRLYLRDDSGIFIRYLLVRIGPSNEENQGVRYGRHILVCQFYRFHVHPASAEGSERTSFIFLR